MKIEGITWKEMKSNLQGIEHVNDMSCALKGEIYLNFQIFL